MRNELFEQARQYVELAKLASSQNTSGDTQMAIGKAKNALSSAYANSTVAEQKQLRELQNELNQLS